LVVDLYGASAAVKADVPSRVPAPAQPAAKDVPSEKTAKGAVAVAPAKSAEVNAVKSAGVPPANNSAVESQSLPALPSTPPSSPMGVGSPPRETASNLAKDSEKLAATSISNTAQDDEVTASTPPPAAAEKTAAHSPKVTYQDGQLTIIAENSLLSDILSALHAAMGAAINLPASASSERIWVRLGPGPARKVVSDLLSDTDLNFVIQGSTTDVDGIQSVLLTPHSEGSPGISSGPQERMANRQSPDENSAAVASQQEKTVPAETTMASSEDTTPPLAGSPRVGPQSIQANVSAIASESIAHPSPPSSMASEDIRQQLLSMYESRRQMQPSQQSTPPQHNP